MGECEAVLLSALRGRWLAKLYINAVHLCSAAAVRLTIQLHTSNREMTSQPVNLLLYTVEIELWPDLRAGGIGSHPCASVPLDVGGGLLPHCPRVLQRVRHVCGHPLPLLL